VDHRSTICTKYEIPNTDLGARTRRPDHRLSHVLRARDTPAAGRSSAQTLNRAQVYFFDHNQGIDLPSSWRLQSWNGSSYVDVPGASAYPVLANQYNTVISPR